MGIFDQYTAELDKAEKEKQRQKQIAEQAKKDAAAKAAAKREQQLNTIKEHVTPVARECFEELPELVRNRGLKSNLITRDEEKRVLEGVVFTKFRAVSSIPYGPYISASGTFYWSHVGTSSTGSKGGEYKRLYYDKISDSKALQIFIDGYSEHLLSEWEKKTPTEAEMQQCFRDIPRVIIEKLFKES